MIWWLCLTLYNLDDSMTFYTLEIQIHIDTWNATRKYISFLLLKSLIIYCLTVCIHMYPICNKSTTSNCKYTRDQMLLGYRKASNYTIRILPPRCLWKAKQFYKRVNTRPDRIKQQERRGTLCDIPHFVPLCPRYTCIRREYIQHFYFYSETKRLQIYSANAVK